MKRYLFLFLLMMLTGGCVKEVDWQPEGNSTKPLVVEAILTDEPKEQSVRLSLAYTDLNGTPPPVTGAEVLISNEDSTWYLTESTQNPGTYLTPPWFFAQQGSTYTLVVYSGDQIYTALTTVLPGELFSELRYTPDGSTGFYRIDWVASSFSTSGAAMWEVLVDWSMVPGYEQSDSLSTHARLLYYTLPTLDVSEIFAPMVESVKFPAGTLITERRYSLTPEYAAWVREMLLETNWSGGLFPQASANLSSNISNDAFGFFTACGVTQLSLTVQRK